MQNLLISPGEVIELAFSSYDQIDPALITDTRIEAAQLKFLAPAVENLYAPLTEGLHRDFCQEFIKPALAYFVRYHLFLTLAVRIGNQGINQLILTESSPVEAGQLARLRRESRETAQLFLQKAIDFIRQNPLSFPEWDSGNREKKLARVNGGIIIK